MQAGIGSGMVSKELLSTKQLFAVDASKAHGLLSQATAKKGKVQVKCKSVLFEPPASDTLTGNAQSKTKTTCVNSFAGFV